MSNIYYIENNNSYLIDKKIKQLNKELKYEVIYYDYTLKNIQEVIEELDTYNFLIEHKIIVLTSSNFLKVSPKKSEEKNFESLKKYLKNPNKDHILIFANDEISSLSSITKILKKSAEEIKIETDIRKIIKEELKDYKYDFGFVRTLLYYTNEDIDITISELNKLKILKIEEKELTSDDVIKSVRRIIDDSNQIFYSLIDNILSKNIKKSLDLYNDLKNAGIDDIKIIATLASQLRLMLQVKCLENKTDKEICEKLNVKSYPVIKARERAYNYTKKEIAELLKMLSDIDYSIKTSDVDSSLLVEMFIYNQSK